jgi:hypothetical protein
MTPDPRSAVVERLAAELASWTGAQGDEGWWDGEVPKGDEPVPADYPDIEEHERRCRAQYAPHFDRVHPSAAEKYTTERAAWIARAEKVLQTLNLIPAPPAELVARVRETRPWTDLEWDDESDDDNEGQHVVERGNQAEHEAALIALGRHVAEQLAAGRGVP